MSTTLLDADLSTTQLGIKRRRNTTVGQMADSAIADVFADYAQARAASDLEQMLLILDHAAAIDPTLVDELRGFDYPATA